MGYRTSTTSGQPRGGSSRHRAPRITRLGIRICGLPPPDTSTRSRSTPRSRRQAHVHGALREQVLRRGASLRPGRGDAAPLRTACGCFRAVAARARGFPRARAAQRAGDNAFRSIAAALQPMSLAPLRRASSGVLPESWLSGFCAGQQSART